MSLLNAHTHLELSDLGGQRPATASEFFPWIQNLARALAARTEQEVEAACAQGIAELLRAGTTHIGDISATGLSVAPLARSGLSGIVWIEFIALKRSHIAARLDWVQQLIDRARRQAAGSAMRIGLTPHATYTVHPAAWEPVLRLAEREALPLCVHVAESPAEWQLFTQGGGPLGWFEAWMGLPRLPRNWSWLAARNVARAKPLLRRLGYPYRLTRGQSPVEYLRSMGVLELRPWLVHLVQVDDADIASIHRSGSVAVHCPRSNELLSCGRMPLEKFLRAGIPVLLGTDSLASSPSLDILDETRAAIELHAGRVPAAAIESLARNTSLL